MDLLVCTDARLSSATNRVFNSYDGEDGLRGYITTQPVKTLKEFLQEWCLADDGWSLDGDDSGKKYKISELDEEEDKDKIFYKTRWIKEEGLVHTDKGDRKEIIENEEKYNGLYAVCTNLDESISSIVKANKRRWEIEECFRIINTP